MRIFKIWHTLISCCSKICPIILWQPSYLVSKIHSSFLALKTKEKFVLQKQLFLFQKNFVQKNSFVFIEYCWHFKASLYFILQVYCSQAKTISYSFNLFPLLLTCLLCPKAWTTSTEWHDRTYLNKLDHFTYFYFPCFFLRQAAILE